MHYNRDNPPLRGAHLPSMAGCHEKHSTREGTLPSGDKMTLEYIAANQVNIIVREASSGAQLTVVYDPTTGAVSPSLAVSLNANATPLGSSLAQSDVVT